ncbi:hypothetical protein [Nostoc sp. 106C]|nr:hypothetical protein [Nostoc sp. 106C]
MVLNIDVVYLCREGTGEAVTSTQGVSTPFDGSCYNGEAAAWAGFPT